LTYHALVVDDTPAILDDVRDRLESMGHTCDCVGCQDKARELLLKNRYSYAVLDLEIPVRYGRPSRIQNGANLLNEIRSTKGYERLPVICMTSHGHDGPDLAISVLRGNGATDYVRKPFPEEGHTLEKAVRDALAATGRDRPGAATLLAAAQGRPPQPFEQGDMVFFEDRVELCGVKVCGNGDSGMIRRILEELKQKAANGEHVRRSGEDLARRVECERGQNGVAECIRDFRNAASQALCDEANIECNRLRDIIVNDRRYGYRLSKKIVVRNGDDLQTMADDPQGNAENAEKGIRRGLNDPVMTPNDPQNDPVNDPQSDPVNQAEIADLNERQQWAMQRLAAAGKVRCGEIAAQFDCSSTTAKRDMKQLRRMGKAEFHGPPRTGHWRPASG